MQEYFIMAWRNLWRNKSRTLITMASVFFAVLLAIMARGFQLGAWDYMIDGILHSYTGYIQIHRRGFWEDRTLEYAMEWSPSLAALAGEEKEVKNIIPRFESFALVSSGNKTKGVIVNGIDPVKEDEFTGLSRRLIAGKYLAAGNTGILLSSRLAEFLKVQAGDTVILIGQGYHGAAAAAQYQVKGVVKLPSLEFDNKILYLPLPVAQEFYSAGSLLTSLVIDIAHPVKMKSTARKLAEKIPPEYEVMTWHEMLKELYQEYLVDNGGGIIMLFILYLIVGFGVFGTVLMMTAERMREFAMMMAVGMKQRGVVLMTAIELAYIAGIGLLCGIVCSLPLLAWFHHYPIRFTGEVARLYEAYGMQPIVPVAWRADYIVNQGVVVGFIVLLAVLYPLYTIYKLKLPEVLRK